MRMLARIGGTLAGLALLAPAARAELPLTGGFRSQAGTKASKKVRAPKKVCAQCQYRSLLAKGVRLPAPPSLPPGTPVKGEECGACGAPTAVVSSGKLYRSGMTGAAYLAQTVPGRAVVGANPSALAATGDPLPIGMVAPRVAAMAPVPSAPGRGVRDDAVMPTSVASDPITAGRHNPPHVLSHLFGISAIGRDRAEARARRKMEKHASIPYGPQAVEPLTELPASMVYGRRGH